MYEDAKDCEQYNSNNTCCSCRNSEWYRLYQEYKNKENEKFNTPALVEQYNQLAVVNANHIAEIRELKKENENLNKVLDVLLENNLGLRKTLSEIESIIRSYCCGCKEYEPDKNCQYCIYARLLKIIKRSNVSKLGGVNDV